MWKLILICSLKKLNILYNKNHKEDNGNSSCQITELYGCRSKKIYFQIKDEKKEQSINSILDACKAHCIPKRNLVMSQFKFFQRKQNLSKPLKIFFMDLKELVKNCQFKKAE